MSPELWQRIEKILVEVLKRPLLERPALLDQACGDQPELRQEVESLLASAEKGDGLMDETVASMLLWQEPELQEGSRIGSYRILHQIGSGGMGRVYLASRADSEYKQLVAIKLLREGLGGDHHERRFRHERQILAQLEHPNIARLMDGGTTERGQPYFVMESVDGAPIDQYCSAHRLGPQECVELFVKVCSAVHFLHQNLVLHRDLKPGNVLVNANGEPKLLDFGIAKPLDPDRLEMTALTTIGVAPMTLAFASPEQVRGQPLTTASDVYALGVLLYRLLTGHHPYRRAQSLQDQLDQICQEEPERPSRAISHRLHDADSQDRPGTESPTASPSQDGERATLAIRLAGDLDSIILKALAKDPRRRYASAEQLAEDLQRYLKGLPVVARDPTWAYRAWKFVRRHRVEVIAAAVVLALLGGFSLQMKILKELAVQGQEQAKDVTHFMVGLFQVADPRKSHGEETTARKLLDEGTVDIQDKFQDQPQVQAALLTAMGRSYVGLGSYEKAVSLLAKSLELRRSHGENPEVLVDSLLNLGHAVQLHGDYAAANTLFTEALDLLGRGSLTDPLLARTLNSVAGVLMDQGQAPAAEPLYREALAVWIELHGTEHPEVAAVWNNLVDCLDEQGRYTEAEQYCHKALDLRIRLHGRVSQEVASSMNTCAGVLEVQEDLEGAERLLRDSLEIRQELYSPQHPKVAIALNNLASLLHRRGRPARENLDSLYKEAGLLYDQARAILEEREPESPSLGAVLINQAELWLDQGKPKEAEVAVRRALEIFHEAYPEGHWRIVEAESVLGSCLVVLGHFEEGKFLLEQS